MNLHDILMASKIAENPTDSADFVQKNDVSAIMQEYGIDSKTQISEIENQAAENACTLGYTAKNFLKITEKSGIVSGVEITVNDDGTIVLNGTAEARIMFPLTSNSNQHPIDELPENFVISAKNATSSCGLGIQLSERRNGGYVTSHYDYGTEKAVNSANYPSAGYYYVYLLINEGAALENVTLYPMIRSKDVKNADFSPYAPTVAERFADLEARIAALETANQTTIQEGNL